MTDVTLPRETGAEKAGATCPECGAELPAVTSSYGSVRVGACPNDHGSPKAKEPLASQQAAAASDPVDDPSDEDDEPDDAE